MAPRTGPVVGPRTGLRALSDAPSPVPLSGASFAGQADEFPTPPSGIEFNDFLLMEAQSSNEPIAVPSGWTQIGTQQGIGAAATAGSTRLARFWTRAKGPRLDPTQVLDPGNHLLVRIFAYRNVREDGNPIDVEAGDTAASSTSVAIPGATTTGPNRTVVAAVADATDATGGRLTAAANANLVGTAEQADFGTIQGTGGGISVVTGVKRVAGAYGNTTATLAPASAQARHSVALRPRE